MDVIDLCSDSEQEIIEILSDDDDEQDQFQRDLELAKQLSLSEYQRVTPKQFSLTPTIKEKFKSKFKRIKFDWKSHAFDKEEGGSICISDASDSDCDRGSRAKKFRKLEDGRHQAQDEYFSDDLPDLEIINEPILINNQQLSHQEVTIQHHEISCDQEKTTLQKRHNLNAEGDDVISVQVIEEWNSCEEEVKKEDPLGGSEEEQIKSPPRNDVKEIQPGSYSSSPEVLLSEKAKSNLANILKRVKSLNEGNIIQNLKLSLKRSEKTSEAILEQEPLPGTSVAVTSVDLSPATTETQLVHKTTVKSISELKPQFEPLPSTSAEDSDWHIQPLEVSFDEVANKKPRKCRVKKSSTYQNEAQKISGDIRSYLSPIKKCESIEKQRICEFLKPLRIHFEENSIEKLTLDMESLHINTVQACFDEEDADCLRRGLQFMEDFLYSYKPNAPIVKHVLEHGLLRSRDLNIMLKSYNLLVRINQKYSGLIKMDWEMLKDVMDELCIGRGLFQQDPIILCLGSHFLQLFILVLETDLHQRDLTQNIRQSLAYKLLSYDFAYLNLKELINWTVCAITCGEYTELLDERYIQRQKDNNSVVRREDLQKILPLLNKLLALSIKVSSSCKESARIIASELLKSYSYFPSLQHKRLLIESMKSDLLRYRFVVLVLERDSEDYVQSCEFPIDLKLILESLFTMLPPRYCLTPPTTPQSDDEGVQLPQQANVGQYPTGEVEEFVMLLYYMLQGHLHCTRRRSYRSLRTQAYYKPKDVCRLLADDERELPTIPSHIEELRNRLLRLTPELTTQTNLYLAKMACLSAM